MEETKSIQEATPEKVEKDIQEFKPNPAFVSAGSLLPKSYKDVMELATIMCKSNIVPKDMIGRPESCAVAIMYGLELGLSPTQGIQNVMIVNGRPSLWGDAVKALVVGSGKCEIFDEDPPHVALEEQRGRCRLVRKKEFGGGEVTIEFSIEDAKRAKLWTKPGPWQDYPGRMLMFRARGWACRDLFPDVLKGMQMREELADYEIIHPHVQMPTRKEMPKAVPDVQEATVVKETPAVEMENDAQEPADLDPSVKISDDRRKDLFKLRNAAGVGLEDTKKWLSDKGLRDSSELTNALADEFEAWIAGQKK